MSLHKCKVIGYMRATEDPEQEVSILFDTFKNQWWLRIWRPDIHGRAVFVGRIKCCPFCCEELKIKEQCEAYKS